MQGIPQSTGKTCVLDATGTIETESEVGRFGINPGNALFLYRPDKPMVCADRINPRHQTILRFDPQTVVGEQFQKSCHAARSA